MSDSEEKSISEESEETSDKVSEMQSDVSEVSVSLSEEKSKSKSCNKSSKSSSDRGLPPPVPSKPPRIFELAKGSRSRTTSQSPNCNSKEHDETASASGSGEDEGCKQNIHKNSQFDTAGINSSTIDGDIAAVKAECAADEIVNNKNNAHSDQTEQELNSSTITRMKNVEIFISDFDHNRDKVIERDDTDMIPLVIDELPILRNQSGSQKSSGGNKGNLIEDVNDETSHITGCSWDMDDDETDCSSSSIENDESNKGNDVCNPLLIQKRKTTVGCATTTCAGSQIKDQIVVVKLAAKVVQCPSSPSSISVSPRPAPPPPPIPSYPDSTDTSSASNPSSEKDPVHKTKLKAGVLAQVMLEDDDPGKDGNEPGAEETSTSELYQNMVVSHGLMIGKERDNMEILVKKVDRQHMVNGGNSCNQKLVGPSLLLPTRPLTEGKGVDDLSEDEDLLEDDHCYQNVVVKKGKFSVATKKSNKKSSCDPSVQSVSLMENGYSTRISEMDSSSDAPVPIVHAVINLPPRKASLIKERRRNKMENMSYQKASRINQLMVAEYKAAGNDRPSSVSIRDGKVMSVTSNNCSEMPNSDGTADEPGSIIGKVKIGFGLNKAKSSLQKSKSVVSSQVEKAGKSMSSMKRKVGTWYHKRVRTPVEQLGSDLGFDGVKLPGSSNSSQAGESSLETISAEQITGYGGRRSRSQLRTLRSSTPADFMKSDDAEKEIHNDEVDGPSYSNVTFDRKSVDYSLENGPNDLVGATDESLASEDEDSFRTKGQNEFEELRRVVKQGGDFCKDLATVLQERSELEAQYAKGLSKLSAKLLKASKEATGSVAHAWQAVAVQIDTQAELHRQWSTALAEEVARPLRSSLETQHKIRKSVEVLVEKTTRNLAEWRTAESKAKRQCFSSSKEFEKLQESSAVIVNNNLNSANSTGGNNTNPGSNSNSNSSNLGGSNLALAEVRTRSRLLSVPPMEKDPIKLETKRRKAEETVRRADIEYYTFCVRSERARLEWESAIRNGSTCLRTLEEEKLSLLRDLAIKYYQYLNELAPRQVQSVESLEEPVKKCSVSQDMHAIVDIRRHAGAEQLLPDFYAEDTSNLMKRERRQEALQKFLYLVNQDLEREKKGAVGIETLAKAIAEAPKIDNAHHDISDKLYYVKSMLLYLEGTRSKVDNSLADIEGRQRTNNPITQYMRHQRDKQGFPQTILKVPSWAKDECLAFCTGIASAGSNSPDWNDRGNADGTSGRHETDFDEFSSQDSGCDHNTDSCGEESNKAPSNLISAPSIGRCKAIYDYDANLFDELTIRTGDVINIHDKQEDGWWLGELNGIIGIFPATYVEEISSSESNSGD